MTTNEFEENLSLQEEGFKIEDDDLEELSETVINLSPAGKDIKNKIKDIIDKHGEDDIIDGAKNIAKTRGYNRKMCDKITLL